MTPKEITEGNILIAEFLGIRKNVHNQDQYLSSSFPDKIVCEVHELKYHSSWDWIMPVVEKISRIKIEWEDVECNYTYYPRTFGMLSPSGNPMVRINANQVFEASTLIEATWLAVVDFIKWYNQQNAIN